PLATGFCHPERGRAEQRASESRELLFGTNYMNAPQGHCWLCNKYGKLSKEHIPPKKAFNDCPLLLMKIDEHSTKKGVLEWAPDRQQRGVYFRSLCEACNNRYGAWYGEAYVHLVRRIAE